MKPRVLITGGSGLLALNWALAIRDQYSVTLGIHERDVCLADVQSLRIDLESVASLSGVIEAQQFQLVIHAAGFTDVDACQAQPDLAQHINVDLASNVARACGDLAVPLVHISTDHLFTGHASFVDELESVAPVNVYGRTKAEAEVRVLAAHPHALIVRTNFYAWGTPYRHSFSDWIIQTLRAGKSLTLFQDVFYTPILVESAICAIHELIGRGADGIFNVVGGERISKAEFGFKVAKVFNLDSSLIHLGFQRDKLSFVPRPRDMSLSNKKLCKVLGRECSSVTDQVLRLQLQEQDGVARELNGVRLLCRK